MCITYEFRTNRLAAKYLLAEYGKGLSISFLRRSRPPLADPPSVAEGPLMPHPKRSLGLATADMPRKLQMNFNCLTLGLQPAGVLPWGMSPLDQCMQSLAAGVLFDDLNGVVLMEEAINSFMRAAGPESEARIAALDLLAEAVRRRGWTTLLAGHILAYITQQRDGLAGD
jgi:hypothetical protein